MVETLCTAAIAKLHAGKNYDTSLTASDWTTFINQAEGEIALETKRDWVAIYSTLSDNVKKVLELACALLAANFAIKYNMNTYLSIQEAQRLVDINNYYYEKALAKLKERQFQDFIISPSGS